MTLLLLAGLASGQSAGKYHSGKLLQMESVQCVVESTDSARPADPKSCQEYVLAGENVLFHLHPQKDETVLLPVGHTLEYRIREGHFYLRLNGHDRELTVVAMEPIEARQPAVHSAEKINHLQ